MQGMRATMAAERSQDRRFPLRRAIRLYQQLGFLPGGEEEHHSSYLDGGGEVAMDTKAPVACMASGNTGNSVEEQEEEHGRRVAQGKAEHKGMEGDKACMTEVGADVTMACPELADSWSASAAGPLAMSPESSAPGLAANATVGADSSTGAVASGAQELVQLRACPSAPGSMAQIVGVRELGENMIKVDVRTATPSHGGLADEHLVCRSASGYTSIPPAATSPPTPAAKRPRALGQVDPGDGLLRVGDTLTVQRLSYWHGWPTSVWVHSENNNYGRPLRIVLGLRSATVAPSMEPTPTRRGLAELICAAPAGRPTLDELAHMGPEEHVAWRLFAEATGCPPPHSDGPDAPSWNGQSGQPGSPPP